MISELKTMVRTASRHKTVRSVAERMTRTSLAGLDGQNSSSERLSVAQSTSVETSRFSLRGFFAKREKAMGVVTSLTPALVGADGGILWQTALTVSSLAVGGYMVLRGDKAKEDWQRVQVLVQTGFGLFPKPVEEQKPESMLHSPPRPRLSCEDIRKMFPHAPLLEGKENLSIMGLTDEEWHATEMRGVREYVIGVPNEFGYKVPTHSEKKFYVLRKDSETFRRLQKMMQKKMSLEQAWFEIDRIWPDKDAVAPKAETSIQNWLLAYISKNHFRVRLHPSEIPQVYINRMNHLTAYYKELLADFSDDDIKILGFPSRKVLVYKLSIQSFERMDHPDAQKHPPVPIYLTKDVLEEMIANPSAYQFDQALSHGSTSASLPGVARKKAMIPLGELLAQDLPFIFSGELGAINRNLINHINNKAISFIMIKAYNVREETERRLDLCNDGARDLGYAEGFLVKKKQDIFGPAEKWFPGLKKRFEKAYQSLTPQEKSLVDQPFPLVYQARQFDEQKTFSREMAEWVEERFYQGHLNLGEGIKEIFIPQKYMAQAQAYLKSMGIETVTVLSYESLLASRFMYSKLAFEYTEHFSGRFFFR